MKKGFTLVELIVAVSLSIIVLASLFSFLLALLKWRDLSSGKLRDLDILMSAIQTMSREIKSSKGISPLSSKDRIILIFDAYTISFDLNAGKIRRIKGGSTGYLTPDSSVNSLLFTHLGPKQAAFLVKPTSTNQSLSCEAYSRNGP